METEKELTRSNYRELIPTIISNADCLQNSRITHSMSSCFSILNDLPTPSESEVNYLIYDKNIAYYVKDALLSSERSVPHWRVDSLIGNLMTFYVLEFSKEDPTFLSNIYKDTDNEFLLTSLLRNSIYPDLESIELLANRMSVELQLAAVQVSGKETLLKLRSSPHTKVRVETYKRLGILDYLDEMLLDRTQEVRLIALEWMPRGYRVPQKALSDRAYNTFSMLIERVSLDQIPMLLGDKKLSKTKWLTEKIQDRLNSKY